MTIILAALTAPESPVIDARYRGIAEDLKRKPQPRDQDARRLFSAGRSKAIALAA